MEVRYEAIQRDPEHGRVSVSFTNLREETVETVLASRYSRFSTVVVRSDKGEEVPLSEQGQLWRKSEGRGLFGIQKIKPGQPHECNWAISDLYALEPGSYMLKFSRIFYRDHPHDPFTVLGPSCPFSVAEAE